MNQQGTDIITTTKKDKENYMHILWDVLRLPKWLHKFFFITDLLPVCCQSSH